MKSKSERLTIFVTRLCAHPAFSDEREALEGIASILDEVEDEFSGVARNPAAWELDGRLYPPKGDIARPDPAREGVTEFRNRAHSTFIGKNGGVEIVLRNKGRLGDVIYRREGADGNFLEPIT